MKLKQSRYIQIKFLNMRTQKLQFNLFKIHRVNIVRFKKPVVGVFACLFAAVTKLLFAKIKQKF